MSSSIKSTAILLLALLASASVKQSASQPLSVDSELDESRAVQQVADRQVQQTSASQLVAPNVLIRKRRSTPFSQFPQASSLNELDEELSMRRLLPELIAQARYDKSVERALLKMLISASLRSSSGPYAGQDVVADFSQSEQIMSPMARLSAGFANEAVDEPSSGIFRSGLAQVFQPRDSVQAIVDKREYTKSCSFNAVSCPKNPFRKL